MKGEGVDQVGRDGHKGCKKAETDEAGTDDWSDPVDLFLGCPTIDEYYGGYCQNGLKWGRRRRRHSQPMGMTQAPGIMGGNRYSGFISPFFDLYWTIRSLAAPKTKRPMNEPIPMPRYVRPTAPEEKW